MPPGADFDIEVDAAAAALLRSRTSNGPKVIKYDVHRCCGGGKNLTVERLDPARRDESAGVPLAARPRGAQLGLHTPPAGRRPPPGLLAPPRLRPCHHPHS